MKKLLYTAGALLLSAPSFAQTTVSFKPDAAIGEDAILSYFAGNCVPYGYPATPAALNMGSAPNLYFSDWTYYSGGCSEGTDRALIRFTQLSTIPSTATITSATLRLRTVPPSGWGYNSYYPGSPYPNSNEGWLYRVTPGYNTASSPNNWDENTVTWNTQPSVTGSPVAIPVTTSQWSFVQNIDVTGIVQQIVTESGTDAYANNGFLLKLQNEAYYRSQNYASSDYSDPDYWPELIVTYTNCNADFNSSYNSNTPYNYSFSATDNTNLFYNWEVNGGYAGNQASMNFLFPYPGSYNVCLTAANAAGQTCKKCITLCIGQNEGYMMAPAPATKTTAVPRATVMQGKIIQGDDLTTIRDTRISPNPAKEGWNISVKAPEKGMVTVTVSDVSGKVLSTRKAPVTAGDNTVYQPAAQLTNGIYFIEVKGGAVSFKEKAVKN